MTKMLKTISVVVSMAVSGYSSCALATDYAALTAGLAGTASSQWGLPGNTKLAFAAAAEPAVPDWTIVSPRRQSDDWLKAYVETVTPPGLSSLDWRKADRVTSGMRPDDEWLTFNWQVNGATGLKELQSGFAAAMASDASAGPIDYARLLRPLDPGAADFEFVTRDGSDRI
jgi:hypothetical protein